MKFKEFIIKNYLPYIHFFQCQKTKQSYKNKKENSYSFIVVFLFFFYFFTLPSLSFGGSDSEDDSSQNSSIMEKSRSQSPPKKKQKTAHPQEGKSTQSLISKFFTSKISTNQPPSPNTTPLTTKAPSSPLNSLIQLPPLTINSSGNSNTISTLPSQHEAMEVDESSDEERKAIREEAEKGLKTSTLNIYLLKKHEKLSPPSEIPEDKQNEFGDFPWQYINENKYSLIGAPHDKEYFIDGQLYTQIKDGEGEEIYVFQETGIRQTEWTKVIYQQAKKHKGSERTRNPLYESAQYREPKGAVVFVKKKIGGEERFFALTFGMTGRFLLNFDYCDPAFGKHYAYNMLSINPGYKAQAFTEVNLDEKKLKHEQAKLNGKVEVSRGVRAFVPKALTVTDGKKQVSSFLGAHICISGKFAFETIGELCRDSLKMAERVNYQKKYSHIDDFSPLENEEEINKIFIQGLSKCHIENPFEAEGNPDIQAVDKFELRSRLAWDKNFPSLERSYDDFSLLANGLVKFIRSNPSASLLQKLKKLKIVGKNSSNYQVCNWRGDQLVTATIDSNNKTYWIEGGEVFEVHKNFIEKVNKKLDNLFWARKKLNNSLINNILPANSSLNSLTPFNDTDKKLRQGKLVCSENAYNERMAKTHPDKFFLCDCGNIQVDGDPNPHSKVEPCDLLSKEWDLIHLKRWSSSSEILSYLPLQGLSSASLLSESKKFRDEFIKKLPKNGSFEKAEEVFKDKKFRVVLGFIHEDEEITPSGLAFNAKLALLKGVEELEKLELESMIISIKDDTTKQKNEGSAKEKKKDRQGKKSSSKQTSPSQGLDNPKDSSTNQALPSSPSTSLPSSQDFEIDSEKKSTQGGTSSTLSVNGGSNGSSSTNSMPPDIDSLKENDYKNVKIPLRENVDGLSLRNKPLNPVGEPQQTYKADGKTFKLQNVSGKAMRCFFNAVGLEAETEIKKLKSKSNDPVVRYMVANEIVSAAANPDQLPKQVKETINYTLYEAQRESLDSLETVRSDKLASQSSNGNLQNPQALPLPLQTTKQRGDQILEELRQRAFSLKAFNDFMDYHIGSERMMVALHDVKGEKQDNINANYTSIDAIAYINNLGIKVYQPTGKESLRLAHQYIPQGATEVVYIYHEGVHFQALIPE